MNVAFRSRLVRLIAVGASVLWSGITIAESTPGITLYDCAPQQLLMGQWSVRISQADHDYLATTSYLKSLYPGAKPAKREIPVTLQATPDREQFSGERFDLVVFPRQAPAHNPFYRDTTAVAATLTADFAEGITLKHRPYACRPVTNTGLE